ncbi:hypothetical protein pb186bvf_014549 [Paramecium bursaria]
MDIQKQLKTALSSYDSYNQTQHIKHKIICQDKQAIQQTLYFIREILCNDYPSTIKILSLRLNKELVETFNDEYIQGVQTLILPELEIIAQYKSNLADDDRGKTYFLNNQDINQSNKELQDAGNQYFRGSLECIWVWNKWFPLSKNGKRLSNFKVTFERLHNKGVKFPTIQYFDVETVTKYLPQTYTPMPLLKQLRELLQRNLDSKHLCKYLYLHPPKEYTKFSTYAELLQDYAIKRRKNKNRIKRKIPTIIVHPVDRPSQIVSQQQIEYSQSMAIEKQQLQEINFCLQQKNTELSKQVVQLQNQTVILKKEIELKQQIIDGYQTELLRLNEKFRKIEEQFNHMNNVNVYALHQMQNNMMTYEIEQEISSLKVSNYKYSREFSLIKTQFEESQIQLDIARREKQQLMFENNQMVQQIGFLEKKNPHLLQQKLELEAKLQNQELLQKNSLYQSKLLLQEQEVIKYCQQLQTIKEEFLKIDKLNTSHSASNISIHQQPRASNLITAGTISRQSKQLVPPYVEYNPLIFAIHPNSLSMKFRQSCLLSKSILYHDDHINVGVTTSVKTNILHLTMHISNKSNIQVTNFLIKYNVINKQDLQVIILPEQLQPQLSANESIQQKIQIQYNQLPYLIPEGVIYYKVAQIQQTIQFSIPCTINKFFNYLQLPEQLPQTYFYNSKPFPSSFQNQLSQLLPTFQLNHKNEGDLDAYINVEIDKKQFLILISCKKSIMQIRIAGDYHDKIAETIVSTYQGLLMKR